MLYTTFSDADEGSTLASQIQTAVRNACDASAVQAAQNRSLVPHDAQVAYVDLGDGTVQYYLNDEARAIVEREGISIASARLTDTLPSDAANVVSARLFRQQ